MRTFVITVNGTSYEVNVDEVKEGQVVTAPAKKAEAPAQAPAAAPAAGGEKVNSPMPGTIMDIKVANGATVNEGDVILTLEAMKMENAIYAPCSGTVTVAVSKGATVNTGDLLATIG